MQDDALFRPEALDAQRTRWLGPVTLRRPPSFRTLTLIALLCGIALVCFAIFGSYTKRSTVTGELTPVGGFAKVFPTQNGIVIEKHAREGQAVQAGDVLYVLSLDRPGSAGSDSLEHISRQVEQRRASLARELAELSRLHEEQRTALTHKRALFQNELRVLDQSIEGQRQRIALAEDTLSRYRDLLAKDYIAGEQVQLREADWIDQRSRLQSLQRDRLNLTRELALIDSEQERQPIEFERQRADLERRIATTDQELTESELRRRLVITAPRDGIVTAVSVELGQMADASRPLVAVIPQGATLQAHLFAPSRAVGFTRPGDRAMIRLDAFPYQKFGHLEGRVAQITRAALSPQELATLDIGATPTGPGESLYRITVTLPEQAIDAYGQSRPLQVGMRVEADLMQEKRQLYEWALEPLLSLSGRL